MGAVVLDASVLLGFFNPDDALGLSCKRALSAARDRGDEFVLPASAFAESLVWTARDRPDQLDAVAARFIALFGDVRPADRAVAISAARLRAAHRSLRLPDALVIATGLVEDASVLTCDKRLGAVDDRVEVITTDP